MTLSSGAVTVTPPAPTVAPVGGIVGSLTQTGADGIEPGLGSSEFWVSLATEILLLVGVFHVAQVNDVQRAAILAIVPMLYVVARTVRKTWGI